MLIDLVGGTGEAAKIASVARDTVNNWRKEGVALPFQKMLKLTERAGLSMDWLAGAPEASTPLGDNDYALIPALSVEASAGSGSVAAEEDAGGLLAFRRDWLRRVGISPVSARALKARGDSMEPTIRDGDLLLIDTSIDRVLDEGIYVVVVAGLALVKRLGIRRDGTVTLKSDNAALYREELIPPHETGDLIVAGRVMWFGRSI